MGVDWIRRFDELTEEIGLGIISMSKEEWERYTGLEPGMAVTEFIHRQMAKHQEIVWRLREINQKLSRILQNDNTTAVQRVDLQDG